MRTSVRYLFLPLDDEKLLETGRVEVVQLSDVPVVDSPRFTAIQQCSVNHSTVDLNLCLCFNASSVSDVLVQSAESNARLVQYSVHLVIDHNASGESATEVRELVHYL